tara:strand:- start:864 stop:1097 length:234 start_codon:yes stop_codon:yes gene_type:complete
MDSITQKQILEWKEELVKHKERLEQAEAVVKQETELISMIQGGIQFGESVLKKNESETPSSNKEEPAQQSKAAPSEK